MWGKEGERTEKRNKMGKHSVLILREFYVCRWKHPVIRTGPTNVFLEQLSQGKNVDKNIVQNEHKTGWHFPGLKCQTSIHTPQSPSSALPHHGNRQGPHLPDGYLFIFFYFNVLWMWLERRRWMNGWLKYPQSLCSPATPNVSENQFRL